MRIVTTTILAGVLLAAAPALADDQPVAKDVATPEPSLPPPLWPQNPEPDPAPAVARPPAVVQEATVGPAASYAHAGTMELGASAGMMLSSQFRNINVAPSLGWFVADDFELTAIVAVSNIKAGAVSATTYSALIEPSYHLPLASQMFGFLGMGIGAAYASELGTGLAVAPRIGANFLVGRSGVLTPSLQYQYITHGKMETSNDVSTSALTNAMSVNVGYTAMW